MSLFPPQILSPLSAMKVITERCRLMDLYWQINHVLFRHKTGFSCRLVALVTTRARESETTVHVKFYFILDLGSGSAGEGFRQFFLPEIL